MNVLHLIDTLDLGGAQVIVKNFIESDLPHNQYVFALRSTKICIPINGKVTVFPGEARYSFKPIKNICDFIKNNNIEILHCHLFRSQFFGYIIKRYFFPDIKLIFHEHGPLGSGIDGYFVANLLKLSRKYLDCSIAVSNNVKKQLIVKGKIDSKIIKILNNFIVYADNEENQCLRFLFREKYNIESKTFVVGYAARLVPGKGWSDLIKILDSIKNKNILVLLAGTGPDKKKLEKIIEMKSDSLVNIKYIGYISNMREFYAGVDCFVIPSRAEAFGLTALEAQAAGVPVIASDIPGLTEVVNWGNALLFPVKNSTLLACQISALEHSKMLRERLVRKGYANIKRFEKTAILEQLNQLYQSF